MYYTESISAFLEIAKGYFRINLLFHAFRLLREAEKNADKLNADGMGNLGSKIQSCKQVAETIQFFRSSMVSTEGSLE